MNPLLLAGGLAIARRRIEKALKRTIMSAAAYMVFLTCGAVAFGFLTAAGFLYSAQTYGAIVTCVIVAGLYALGGIIGFLILSRMNERRRKVPAFAAKTTATGASDAAFPGGIASLGLLAVAGFLMAKSLERK